MTSAVPLVLPVDVAGALLSEDRQAAYRKVKAGALPVLPGPGRMRVPTSAIEHMVGRSLTAADIEAAEAKVAPTRARLRKYQSEYREGRLRRPTRNAASAAT